jgi:hypothetical protein
MSDTENNFIPYGVIPTPKTYSASVDNLSGNVTEMSNGQYSGNLNLNVPIENGQISVGEMRGSVLPTMYNAAINKGDFGLAAQIGKEMQRLSASYGPINAGVTKTPMGDTPFVGYQGQNLQVNATPEMIQAGYTEMSPDQRKQFMANGFATKDYYGAQANFKKLYDNGYINIKGEITPQGWNAGIGGEFEF